MNSALIIFVRNPVLGKVKTRLAASLGDQRALDIYKSLLIHTCEISKELQEDKYIFYEDFINLDDIWPNNIYNKKLQHGNNLGARMKDAFHFLFKLGFNKVVIIGSDCFELTTEVLQEAFDRLSTNDIVIGPASDGGYYLLGMKKIHSFLFEKIKWSTDAVLQQTIGLCNRNQLSYFLLSELSDIDEEKDLIHLKNFGLKL